MPHPDRPSQIASDRSPVRRLREVRRRVRRAVLVRRRLLAALLAGLAVVTAVRATSLPPIDTTPVVVAAADLPSGSRLGADDLTTVELPVDAVPAGSVADAATLAGRTLAAPVRGGEPLTDVRLVTPGLLDGFPGLVVAPVRVADPAAVRLLAAGDRIDLVAVSPDGGSPTVVAAGATVVAVPGPDAGDGITGGAMVVVAVPREQALALAEAAVRAVLSVVISR